MTKRFFLASFALLLAIPGMAQVFNCSSGFTASAGACSVNFPGAGSLSFSMVGAFNGSTPFLGPNGSMVINPVGAVHTGNGFVYQTAVNVQAFTSTLASGSYAFPQTTTITDGTAGSAISYCTTTFLGSCSPGTSYTGVITISSTETICANAVFNSSTSSTVCNNYGTQSTGGIIIAKATLIGKVKVQ